ncbi:MAG TPA: ComF family protein [Tepidisphaeraceae bacterium]|nr:ComF family protein [Tepidisphaeraceae bacterium]
MDPAAREFDPHVPPWLIKMGGWLRDVADFCYPGLCPGCRAFCPGGQQLCQICDDQLNALAAIPHCDMCGQTLSYPNAPCPHCINRGVPHYRKIVRLSGFETPIRSLIHQFKYHGRWAIGEMLADRLLKEDRVKALLDETDCLLPVPLHVWRQISRGFNQAEIIAERISQASGTPVIAAISRRRHTETQTHLHSRSQRTRNLKDAFHLKDADAIAGRRVLVIDDVMTTGATLQTLGRALRPARPARLNGLVVAVTHHSATVHK